MIESEKIKKITIELLEESFFNYFSSVKKETKHIVLDRFFPNQRRITSTTTGLQTSLGTYWEKLAVKLAEINGFKVINNFDLMKPSTIPDELSNLISSIKKEREDCGGELDSLKNKLNTLYPTGFIPNENFLRMTKGKGADVIIEKQDKVYLFDIKTVQVNANSGNSF